MTVSFKRLGDLKEVSQRAGFTLVVQTIEQMRNVSLEESEKKKEELEEAKQAAKNFEEDMKKLREGQQRKLKELSEEQRKHNVAMFEQLRRDKLDADERARKAEGDTADVKKPRLDHLEKQMSNMGQQKGSGGDAEKVGVVKFVTDTVSNLAGSALGQVILKKFL